MVSKWLHVSSLHEAAMIQIPQMSLSPQPPRRFGWGTWTGFWGPIVQLTNYEANFLASGRQDVWGLCHQPSNSQDSPLWKQPLFLFWSSFWQKKCLSSVVDDRALLTQHPTRSFGRNYPRDWFLRKGGSNLPQSDPFGISWVSSRGIGILGLQETAWQTFRPPFRSLVTWGHSRRRCFVTA